MARVMVDGKAVAVPRERYVELCAEADRQNAGKPREKWVGVADLLSKKKAPAKRKKAAPRKKAARE